MSLSDIIGNMNLATFPQAALLLFLVVFVFVSVRVIRRPRSDMKACAALPLDDNNTTDTAGGER